jgi:hypothetical protein
MVSYIQLLQDIDVNFVQQRVDLKKYDSDFYSEINNYATANEKYPMLYVTLVESFYNDYTTNFVCDVYCMDIIQKGRQNINTILSDTHLILNDLIKYYKLTPGKIDIINQPSITPINNGLLDYAAGNVARISFELENYSLCDIPLIDNFPSIDTNFIIDEFGNIIQDENGNNLIWI